MFSLSRNPAELSKSDPMYGNPNWYMDDVSTGTTLVAAEYNGGVIIGADSRTSSGTYVANRVTDKLTPLTDYIFCCRSGSAADTQALADAVKYQLDIYRMNMEREPTVNAAATVFKNMCYKYRDSLSAGIIVAGWDHVNGGQVFSIPIGGMIVRQSVSISGSGSTFLYGYLDRNFKPNMKKDACIDFVKTAVALAIGRDGSSGGCIRLANISKDGVERLLTLGDEVPTWYEG